MQPSKLQFYLQQALGHMKLDSRGLSDPHTLHSYVEEWYTFLFERNIDSNTTCDDCSPAKYNTNNGVTNALLIDSFFIFNKKKN